MDAANGGALFNKTPTEARNLISIMASNTQQFRTRYDDPPRKVTRALSSKSSNCNRTLSSSNRVLNNFNQSLKRVFRIKWNPKEENDTKRRYAQKRKPKEEVEIPQDQDDEAKKDNPKVLVTRPPFPERYLATQSFSRNYAPAKISSKKTNGAMCDLGASINVMPLTIFESLHVGPLKETGVVIQLADRSVVYPEGVLEDVLVQVNELVFPADFYILDMREDNFPNSMSILLGRPFLKTTRTKIDVHAGTLTMEFDGEIIRFNIFYSMRYPSDIPTALFVDAFDPFVQKFPAINEKDYIKFALVESPTPKEEGNTGVDPLVQVNAKFDGDSVFLTKINKDLTYGPRTYKNKAFHDKISSRKNSLMNIKVFIGPHHLRKHYIEEVDSECPTYSS
ncbi:UNVERIFIED_CONTAM: hypothetical protein Sangu_3014900 [Sesamum angustifolium]|uniref:Uncharacterized protein n=1 Tax=Sesamum angustifolium TaxID=2727405 RepID=A0AAW2KMQ0_9LAMI